MFENTRGDKLLYINEGELFDFGTNYHQYKIEIKDGSKPFKVTLVWTDPVALTSGDILLVNDLDLRVYSGVGVVYGNM